MKTKKLFSLVLLGLLCSIGNVWGDVVWQSEMLETISGVTQTKSRNGDSWSTELNKAWAPGFTNGFQYTGSGTLTLTFTTALELQNGDVIRCYAGAENNTARTLSLYLNDGASAVSSVSLPHSTLRMLDYEVTSNITLNSLKIGSNNSSTFLFKVLIFRNKPTTGSTIISYGFTRASMDVQGYSDNFISTISNFSTEVSLSNLTTDGSNGQASLSGAIYSQPASESDTYYADLQFKVADGYDFSPSAVSFKWIGNSTSLKAKVAIMDATTTVTSNESTVSNSSISLANATSITFADGAFTDKSFTGTVHIRIYMYGVTGKRAYLASPFTITGTVATVIPASYTVTYNANGGSGTIEDATGASITLSDGSGLIAPSGYSFAGWNTDAHGAGTAYSSGQTDVEADLDLYAVWTQNGAIDKNGGATAGAYTATYNKASIDITTAPTYDEDHSLTGYYEAGTGDDLVATSAGALQASTSYTNVSSYWTYTGAAPTLYAQWEVSHDVTIEVNSATMGSAEAEETTIIEGGTTGITATSNTGYRFVNWTVEGTGSSVEDENAASTTFTMGTDDATVTANFAAKTYTVNLNNQSATTAGTTSVTTTYKSNANLTSNITCPEKNNSVFMGYYTATGGGGLQLIDRNGAWIAGVEGYTDADKKWIKDSEITLTLYAYWIQYAESIDLQAEATDKNGSKDFSLLATKHFSTTLTNSGNSSYDDGTAKEADTIYHGLKMKDNGATISFYVPAGKVVRFEFGYVKTRPTITINGTSQRVSSLQTESSTANHQDLTYITTEESVIVLTNNAANKSTVTLQKILISTNYTRPVSAGQYGTICLPYDVASGQFSGADFYGIAGVVREGETISGIALTDAVTSLTAGTPYIFHASSAGTLSATISGTASDVQAAVGLVGNLSPTSATVDEGNYILYKKGGDADYQVYTVDASATVTCPQYRAYIDLSGVGEVVTAPGVRIIEIANEENNATNIEDLNDSMKTIKFFENGQVLILRDGVVYDALGRIVR
ncbi:MAG: InlB B-repeat-containing protein [Paludibacteraceae bacterium]|nr:InlB B-repeat-containing protein [Paludibacteraceae bacterium]